MVYSWFQIVLKICESIGVLLVFIIVMFSTIKLLRFLWQSCVTKDKWCGGPNTWAAITGCTDGIGLEYSRQLAEKGYNLLLISRSSDKLNRVKEDIQREHPNCKIKTLAIDFTKTDIYDRIEEELKSLEEIHVLVNNVGICYPNERPEYFTQIPNLNQFITDLINVNIFACTRLIALILPRMEQRGRGVIINLSSFAALYPAPLLSLYSATKVYIDFMSRSLHEEYKHKGITIQSVVPFYVSTKMAHNIHSNFYIPTPRRYVKSALKTVGREKRTSGYFVHKISNFLYYYFGVTSQMIGIDLSIKLVYFRLKMIRNRIYKKHSIPSSEDQICLNV